MPDLKLSALLEALEGGAADDLIGSFLGSEGADRPEIDTTRLQPPICYWAVYARGRARAVLKAFFSDADFANYRATLEEYYPDRIDQPGHPLGGLAFLPELNALVWSFPFDPLMPSLHRCMDPDWIADALGHPDRPLVPELVDYAPEIGAMVAYRDPERGRVVAYGKTSPKETCGQIYLVMNRLWESEARRRGVLKLPRPIAFRPEADLLLQTRVYGRPLSGDRNRAVFMRLAEEAGRVLAAVHTTDVPFGAERPLESLIERLQGNLEDLAFLAPPLHVQVRRLLNQLRERASHARPDPPVPSHGDFKYDQFLRYRRQFVLIDFELFCRAEPALDLGTFCAYLPPSRPLGWRDSAAAELLRGAFLKSYARASGQPVDFGRVGLYEAAMLAIRATALVTRQREDWATRASQMLDLAMERLVAPEPLPRRLVTR
ncbi:MAG TPA: phosphotransferase [Chloroflexota bacterium]|jgi:aminoglycoside phosphotransferase (APT) family kinase protein